MKNARGMRKHQLNSERHAQLRSLKSVHLISEVPQSAVWYFFYNATPLGQRQWKRSDILLLEFPTITIFSSVDIPACGKYN